MNVTQRNSLQQTITQAIDKMKKESGHKDGTPFKVNLAELGRRTGLSRKTLRNLQKNDFVVKPHGNTGRHKKTVLSAFTSYIDGLLSQSVSNSAVIYRNMLELGYTGGKSQVKAYIKEHRYLVPIPRASVAPQGDRGVRYQTDPGEMFQMDWGFVNVERSNGKGYRAACFVMVCHHCGKCYIEFFPNAKQENLFIGMIHAFQRLGIPECVLTDNMKSVVTGRDPNGKPIWNKEYETFMNDVGFATKLCKARHPFTKGYDKKSVMLSFCCKVNVYRSFNPYFFT